MNELECFGSYHQLVDLITKKIKQRNDLLDKLHKSIFAVRYKDQEKADLQGGRKIGSAWNVQETTILMDAAAKDHCEILLMVEEINRLAPIINQPPLVLV